MAPRGIYRERNGWGNQHSVFVGYGDHRMDIPEDRYREEGYQPAFESLPWKGEMVAPKFSPGSRIRIGYFAEPLAPGTRAATLSTTEGVFSTFDEAFTAACATADRLSALVHHRSSRWNELDLCAGWE